MRRVVVLDRGGVHRTDGVRNLKQAANRGLLDKSVENVVDDVFNIGEKSINRISRWRFIESTVLPDKTVLEFSCNWTCAIDILIIAV
jgi:hypothetical protein